MFETILVLFLLYLGYLVEKISMQTNKTMNATIETCYLLQELLKNAREHS